VVGRAKWIALMASLTREVAVTLAKELIKVSAK
jgi:hypothetical protein